MPTYNIEQSPFSNMIKEYSSKTNSILTIESMINNNTVQFPAFLTDFSQTFDPTWNTEDVFGRMDPIATYQGTKRTMSLGFDIPAGSVKEAKWNLESCALLTSMVYPAYNNVSGAQVLSKAPLVRINFANLISGTSEATKPRGDIVNKIQGPTPTDTDGDGKTDTLEDMSDPFSGEIVVSKETQTEIRGTLGWIAGLSWKPNLEMGMFSKDGNLYPKIISISFSFNILHERVLDQSTIANTNWPFGE